MPFNRRQFIQSTSAILAAPLFVSSRVFGANNRITVGMIGVGRQAWHVNMPQLFEMSDVQITAVCDVDRWRLNNAKEKVDHTYSEQKNQNYKGCDTYKDFRELITRDDIDAVMVSTPDHWHVPISMAAVVAGKDVSCEKPLTLSIAEGRMLADLVEKHKRVFRTDSEFRSLKPFHRAVELVVNGRVGNVHTIRTGVPGSDVGCEPQPIMPVPDGLDYDMWTGPAPMEDYTEKRVHPPESYSRPGWMRVPATCEGMITNWGAHLNDIAQWGNQTDRTGPVHVEAKGTYPESKGLWQVLTGFEAHYVYENGVVLHYITDYPYVRFEGDEGWVEAQFNGHKLLASSDSILNSEIKDDEIHYPLKSDKRDFIDAVKTRGNTLEDAEVGHRTTSLCQIAHIAIQVGKALDWDPDKETFTNSSEANKLLTRDMREPWTWDTFTE